MKLIGYARVSSQIQAEEGISLDAQEYRIREYCKLYDYQLIDVIRDEGYTAKNTDRPGLQRCLSMLDAKEAEGIIVARMDRLTRRSRDFLHLLEQPFNLISISERIEKDTASGRFQAQILAAMAEFERALICERTKEALAEKARQGFKLGRPPYGYRTHPTNRGEWIPIEQEQRIIQEILKSREEGLSFASIAEALNQKSIAPPQSGGSWQKSSVFYICKREGVETQ